MTNTIEPIISFTFSGTYTYTSLPSSSSLSRSFPTARAFSSLFSTPPCSASSLRRRPPGLQIWHERLAHVDHSTILSMVRNKVVKGIALPSSAPPWTLCSICQLGKATHLPFPSSSTPLAANLLILVYSDVAGPLSVASLSGSRYSVTFIDDSFRWVAVYSMPSKSETLEILKIYQEMAETHTRQRIRSMRSDNGG